MAEIEEIGGTYPIVQSLDNLNLKPGTLTKCWLQLVTDGLSLPVCIPVMIAKGLGDGPTLGITAAVHGNEINGIPVIQRLFRELEVKELSGTVIGVPVVNAISYLRKQRRFNDGTDLNHIMPGISNGNVSDVYANRFIERVVKHFDYLVDLHTASWGRVNSYYIRADMEDEATRDMALLQNADIIVNNHPSDGTLRGAADAMGIPAITLEVGDPNRFQRSMIRSGLAGIYNLLAHFDMLEQEIEINGNDTVLCPDSDWMYTDTGGILRVLPNVTDRVKNGDLVAHITNIFGERVAEYRAPYDGIVIGKETNPVCQTGGRILHLGELPED
jgi:predicted deacylase